MTAAPVHSDVAIDSQTPPLNAGSATRRLVSIDAFRGVLMMAIALAGPNRVPIQAIANEHPDSWFWEQFALHTRHAVWFRATAWDLLMPSFMFMVGVSMVYSYSKRKRLGHSFSQMLLHACYRAAILVALGIFLRSNDQQATRWMFTDVLSQIGLAYVLLFLLWDRSWRTQLAVAASILVGYWALFALTPHVDPNHTQWLDHWRRHANIAHQFDLWFLNLFPRTEPFVSNPHGAATLNFIPAMAVMIFGLMTGAAMRRGDLQSMKRFAWMFGAGALSLLLGLALHLTDVCPIVKRTWTPAFSLAAGGICVMALASLYVLVDIYRFRRWTFPFLVLGANALTVYMLMQLASPWFVQTLETHLGQNAFKVLGKEYELLLQNIAAMLIIWSVAFWMYRRQLFIRI